MRTPDVGENAELGVVLNNLTRTNDGDFRIELDKEHIENDGPSLFYDELVDVGDRRAFLLPGDLVELRYFLYRSCFRCSLRQSRNC